MYLYFHPIEEQNESSLSLLKPRSMSYKNMPSLFIVCTLFSINIFSVGFLGEDHLWFSVVLEFSLGPHIAGQVLCYSVTLTGTWRFEVRLHISYFSCCCDQTFDRKQQTSSDHSQSKHDLLEKECQEDTKERLNQSKTEPPQGKHNPRTSVFDLWGSWWQYLASNGLG